MERVFYSITVSKIFVINLWDMSFTMIKFIFETRQNRVDFENAVWDF